MVTTLLLGCWRFLQQLKKQLLASALQNCIKAQSYIGRKVLNSYKSSLLNPSFASTYSRLTLVALQNDYFDKEMEIRIPQRFMVDSVTEMNDSY